MHKAAHTYTGENRLNRMCKMIVECVRDVLWCVCANVRRALVGMMMYNNETKEIAKPSELLNSIKAIMSVLQSIENYGV